MAETIGTSALQASHQFPRLWPTVLSILSYAAAFYLLSLTFRVMPVGVVYALWSGLGIVFIAIIGWVVFRQSLDLPAIIGMAMIIGGIAVIQLFSGSVTH
jgi:small multidrug resistance pump